MTLSRINLYPKRTSYILYSTDDVRIIANRQAQISCPGNPLQDTTCRQYPNKSSLKISQRPELKKTESSTMRNR